MTCCKRLRAGVKTPGPLYLHLLYLVFQHTLDFIAHGFCAGVAEMNAHLVGGLAGFLHKRGRVLRPSGRGCCLLGTGFAHGRFFLRGLPPAFQLGLRFTRSFAASLVAPAFSSRKFFPAKRIGAHRSSMRS